MRCHSVGCGNDAGNVIETHERKDEFKEAL
jgi:hypothetical protein